MIQHGHQGRTPAARPRLALVLWAAEIGGAETLTLALAEQFRRLGAHAEFVFIGGDGPLVDRLNAGGWRYRCLGHARGRDVLQHTRRYAGAVASCGPDGALIIHCGFLGTALRLGGYGGTIVAAEHGAILRPSKARRRRLLDRVSRTAAAWAADAEVAVSDFILERMLREPHAYRLWRIYNGIDPDAFPPTGEPTAHIEDLVAGFVGRLIPGKGVDVLIRALGEAPVCRSTRLIVAGDGPERLRLEALARDVGIGNRAEFVGMVNDVQSFWSRCDIAVVPSSELAESFSMVAVEAMACGKPVVATGAGALPEVVLDGVTGILVPPGSSDALARAVASYAESADLRRQHGTAARRRCVELFHIADCARAYLKLFDNIAADRTCGRRVNTGPPPPVEN
jgi:glycosyltransferase involved in cell wall biosynthesis